MDVHSPTACSVYVSDSKDHLPSVQQHQLETVVPRADFARVLILRGSHRWDLHPLAVCLCTWSEVLPCGSKKKKGARQKAC